MGYTGSYKDIVYPGPDREPRVLKYRIAFLLDGSPLTPHAIIHVVQSDPKDPPPDQGGIARRSLEQDHGE